jgi:hypothetical protein
VVSKWQQLLDKSTVYLGWRWLAFFGMLGIYVLRVFMVNGWYIVTYGLGIYLLNNFIGFLSPQVKPAPTQAILMLFFEVIVFIGRGLDEAVYILHVPQRDLGMHLGGMRRKQMSV